MKIQLIILLLLTQNMMGQGYINRAKTKEKAKKVWVRGFTKYNVDETDSTLHLTTLDTAYSPLEIILKYNSKGKCIQELFIMNCDSCFQKILKIVLSEKFVSWKRVNENLYVSNFFSSLKAETAIVDGKYYLSVQKYFFTRKEYKAIKDSKKNNY